MAGPIEIERWAEENAFRFPDRDGGDVAAVLRLWRDAAAEASGAGDVELAGSLQRHLTARGTGLPSNFALVLTPTEAIAFKFDARNQLHPIEVVPKQFGKRVAEWPRASVRLGDLDPGRLATGLTMSVDGRDPIPCRLPRLPGNPAGAALIAALGGDLGPE